MKKRLLALSLALCMVFALCACGSTSSAAPAAAAPAASGNVITLGLIGPQTGSLAVYGTHIKAGAQLAVDTLNKAGGIEVGGTTYQLALEVKDDTGDATECMNAMNALIADGIQLVIGSATSGCTSAITGIANSEKIALITPSGTADSLTSTMDFVFRTCFKDSFQGELAAKYTADQGFTKAGIVYCSADTYSKGLRDSFVDAAARYGVEIVAEESVATMADTDFSNQFTKMVSAGAELVFTPFYYDVMGPYLVPQARQAGFAGQLLGCDGVDNTETTISEGSDLSAFNGLYFTNLFSADLAAGLAATFVSDYSAAYGETPNSFDALAYDAVLVYVQAMKTAGATDAVSVQAALADRSASYEGVTGTFSYDETGTPIKPGVLMGYEYKAGDAAVSKISVSMISLG